MKKNGLSRLIYLFAVIGLAFLISCSDDAKPTEATDPPPDDTTDVPPDTTLPTSFDPTRLPGSPYPVSVKPDTLFVVYEDAFTPEQIITIGTLQGVLAQTKPRIYVLERSGDTKHKLWLDDLAARYQTVVNYDYANDLADLINHFKGELAGYILSPTITEEYTHTAISLAGIRKAIVVTSSNEQYAKDAGLALIANTNNMGFGFFINKYKSEMNKTSMCYQTVMGDGAAYLTDYAVFGKMFHMYESSITANFTGVTNVLGNNAALFGWLKDKEPELVREASKKNVFVHAADYCRNLSVLSNYGVTTTQKSHISNPEQKENVHTVCFLISDGDNLQLLLKDFYGSWYNTTKRGKANIGWTMSPALCEMAPTALKLFYDQASGTEGKRDYFVAAPSGVGYMNPDHYADNSSYAALTAEYMKKSDMRVLNIIGNKFEEPYLSSYLLQDQIDGIFYYDYANYAKHAGAMTFSNGKPIITARYNLWPDPKDANGNMLYEDISSLAAKLNAASTDITSPEGYTLVAVNIWSQNVSDIMNCIVKLNESKVRVVAPDEFVALVKRNVTH